MEETNVVIGIGSPEEATLIEEISGKFPEELAENPRLVKFMAACSLRNRGYDVKSSMKRLGKYLRWRREIFRDYKDQTIEDNELLKGQVRAGLLNICPTRMPNGAALIFIRMRHHNPKEFDSHATLRYWHYMILSALIKDPTLAMHGFVFVNNFEGASLANTDFQVPTAISSALNKCMPVRVNSVNFVNPPWVIRMIIPMFKSIFSAKMAARLNVILDVNELPIVLSVSKEVLPAELGGHIAMDSPEGLLQKVVDENIAV